MSIPALQFPIASSAVQFGSIDAPSEALLASHEDRAALLTEFGTFVEDDSADDNDWLEAWAEIGGQNFHAVLTVSRQADCRPFLVTILCLD